MCCKARSRCPACSSSERLVACIDTRGTGDEDQEDQEEEGEGGYGNRRLRIPTPASMLSFLFPPTLIYQDANPRKRELIRWGHALSHFLLLKSVRSKTGSRRS